MQQTFSRQFMEQNCGCYSLSQLNRCSFMTDTISLESILKSEIPLKDKYWFVCKKLATKEQNQQIAINVAEMVLPIYERRYPEDNRPREAIEAAKQYIAGHISVESLIQKCRAAAAAAAAADAADADAYAAAAAAADAYAAAADAYAADAAAADAADADAAAADAYAAAAAAAADAAAAAAAAADAADADAVKQQLLNYLINFCLNPHPATVTGE